MLKLILTYGLIAGAIMGGQIFLMVAVIKPDVSGAAGMAIGYASMIVGLAFTFVAVKTYRDKTLGGVIKFLPALGMGLAISAVATLVYVLAWEACQPFLGGNYMDAWVNSQVETMKAGGASAGEIDKFLASTAGMREGYRNPLFRMALTALEPLPIALIVPFIVAGLLRNSRFMPARPAAS